MRCTSATYCTECASTHTLKSSQNGCILSCIQEEGKHYKNIKVYLQLGTYLKNTYPKKCLKCIDTLPNCI